MKFRDLHVPIDLHTVVEYTVVGYTVVEYIVEYMCTENINLYCG